GGGGGDRKFSPGGGDDKAIGSVMLSLLIPRHIMKGVTCWAPGRWDKISLWETMCLLPRCKIIRAPYRHRANRGACRYTPDMQMKTSQGRMRSIVRMSSAQHMRRSSARGNSRGNSRSQVTSGNRNGSSAT